MTPPDPDSILFLQCRNGYRAHKVFTAAGKESYNAGIIFKVHRRPCPDFVSMVAWLEKAQARPDIFAIRGEPRVADGDYTHRRKHDGSIADASRCWVLLDYDGTRPEGAPDIAEDPEGAARAVLALFPECVQETSIWWQLGNSAGMSPDKYSIHLWALTDRPVGGPSLRRWLKDIGADPTVADSIQPHYIAAPRFTGVADPIGQRSGIIHGATDRMDTAEIRATARVIAAEEAKAQRERDLRAHRRELQDRQYTGPYATVADLMAGPWAHIVSEEAKGGWLHCNCPVHASDSGGSLHINVDSGQWCCHGCRTSGGTAYSLAMFLHGDDRQAAIQDLRRATAGQEFATC